VVNPHYPSDDLLVVGLTSMGDSMRPGEFPIQIWREAGLIHPSFTKRAVAFVHSSLVRRQLGHLLEVDLLKLDVAPALVWLVRAAEGSVASWPHYSLCRNGSHRVGEAFRNSGD
jgi:hypothetical protein